MNSQGVGLRRIAAVFELATIYAAGKNGTASFEQISRACSALEGPAQAV